MPFSENETKLLAALKEHNCIRVKKLINGGVNVNCIDEEEGSAPLNYAARKGCMTCVGLLLKQNADVEKRSSKREDTAAHSAAGYGQLTVLKFLLAKSVSGTTSDKNGWLPLHNACWAGHSEVVKYLLQEYPNTINSTTTKAHGRWAPLHLAAEKNNIECIKLLLEHGAEIDAKKTNGATALIVAAANGHSNAVECLLNKDADGTIANISGWLPLHHACDIGQSKIASLLLSKFPATVNAPTTGDDGRWTPLHMATRKGSVDCIKLLLRNGAHLEAKKRNEFTPLHTAAVNGQLKAAEFLSEQGANLAAVDTNGKRPLQLVEDKAMTTSGSEQLKYGAVVKALTEVECKSIDHELELIGVPAKITREELEKDFDRGGRLSGGFFAHVHFAMWKLPIFKVLDVCLLNSDRKHYISDNSTTSCVKDSWMRR